MQRCTLFLEIQVTTLPSVIGELELVMVDDKSVTLLNNLSVFPFVNDGCLFIQVDFNTYSYFKGESVEFTKFVIRLQSCNQNVMQSIMSGKLYCEDTCWVLSETQLGQLNYLLEGSYVYLL